jgi:amidophosphoribosyltransferase
MCGIVGLIGVDGAAASIGIGLQAIQHRGQDAAGIATMDAQGRLHQHKDVGHVEQALPFAAIEKLPGRAGVGHVRYPTVGTGDRSDSQPFRTRRPPMALAHNGNLTNWDGLCAVLDDRGLQPLSNCDAEVILLSFAERLTAKRARNHSIDDVVRALRETYEQVRGSYTIVALLKVEGETQLIAFRDPHGIRPGVYGRNNGAWVVASESVVMDALGFKLTTDLPPGHVGFFKEGAEAVFREVVVKPPRPCVFERIYFARPDSMMDGERVYASRRKMGLELAKVWAAQGYEADVVVPVPDTSRPAASAMAEALGLPYREGFIKNRYSGRTFIMPTAASREIALRLKLNPIPEIFENQRVILVDDSLVRGATMRRLAKLVHGVAPAALHLAIYSPPVRNPCFYGIDMPTRAELVAAQYPPEELTSALAERFAVDSVTYLPVDNLRAVAGDDICAACFDGHYPVDVSGDEMQAIQVDRRG